MKYKIVSATSAQELEKQVSESMSAGWRPKAGMTVGVDGVFYQAIVSEDVRKGKSRQLASGLTSTLTTA
jgi:hypothetical protein